MKRFLLLLAIVMLGFTSLLKASPGDTTWVQANNVQLSWYNNYDTTISFPSPGTSYRKILMIFTLGKYVCPGSPTYCGDWDYTVQNFVMTPTDTFELGRLITPYANASAPRTPFSWTQHYVFDVTPYATKLTGPAVMRMFYSGYSGGFTGNIRFAFIEGTPERNVIDVKRLWNGSFGFGNATSINTHFPIVTQTAPAGTQSTELKFTVTGHGSDTIGCSEFCSKNYDVMLNGNNVATRTIWRDNCGSNELFPQSGTWLYERANWCPGAMVYPHHNILPGITAGATFATNIAFESYSNYGVGGASYTTEAHLIYYGAMNKTLDASLEDIIAPTNNENYFRENTVCGKPTIHVRNSGATTITAMAINYSVQGGTVLTYNWTGSLASMQETDIVMNEMPDLNNGAGVSGTHMFTATIATVNGVADDDVTNNTMSSQYANASLWPLGFKIVMTTNNEATYGSHSETSWRIYDMDNNIVAQRTDAVISHSYTDTVNLASGCYRLVITDSGCNGLHWWANPGGTTSGSFLVKKLTGASLTMSGYPSSGSYANDFGCGFTKYFYASPWSAGVDNVNRSAGDLSVYPNPAQNNITVDLSGLDKVDGVIKVIDMLGREVMTQKCDQQEINVNISALVSGIYTVQYIDSHTNNKLQTRVVVVR